MVTEAEERSAIEAAAESMYEARGRGRGAWTNADADLKRVYLADAERAFDALRPLLLTERDQALAKGAEEERQRLREVAERKRDELNEAVLRHPGSQAGRDFAAEARAFGWMVNHLTEEGKQ